MDEEQRRAVQAIRRGIQPRIQRWHGRLGSFSGQIEVTDRAGYYWVRIEKGGADFEEGVFRGNLARPVYDLPLLLETDTVTQERRIVGVDQTTINYGVYNGNPVVPVQTERHAATHEWRADADDQLQFLSTNQLYETRCQPGSAAMSIAVQGGPFYAGGAFRWKTSASTVDLSSYWPAITNTKWILVTLDSSGEVVIVDNGAATLSALSGPADNHYAVAAVRLRKLQSAVSWLEDIVDVRFMPQQSSTLAFLDLTDTPDAYAGAAKKIVRVNATPNALEFGAYLDDLEDVDAQTPASGNVLKFDGEKWVPGTVTATTALADLTDVELDSEIFDGDILIWSDAMQVWSNTRHRLSNPLYGNGADGVVTISVNTTLTRDMYYDRLHIAEGVTLHTNGFKIFVQNDLINEGLIDNSGGAGTNAGSYSNPGVGGAGGGAGSCYTAAAGRDGAHGSEGGDPGQAGAAGEDCPYSAGGSSGIAGRYGGECNCTNGGAGGLGGTATQLPASAGGVFNAVNVSFWRAMLATGSAVPFGYHAGNGGAGSGGSCSGESGAGGGGGGDGGAVVIFARLLRAGAIESRGGAGGNGGNAVSSGQPGDNEGGGSPGVGGNGGVIVLMFDQLIDNLSHVNVSGGAPGIRGSGVDGGADGEDADPGMDGLVVVL